MSEQRISVMVVDDSLIAMDKLAFMVNGLGYDVVATANTGEKAIEAYREHKPDVVTMDITMPNMDGIEASRRIIQEFSDARIIMVTSHGQERMVMDALRVGARGYVLKPVRAEKLKDIIHKVLER